MTKKSSCSSKCATKQCILSTQSCTNVVDNTSPFGLTIIPGSGALTEVPVNTDSLNCFDDTTNLLDCIQNISTCPKAFQNFNVCISTCPEFAAAANVNFINGNLVISDPPLIEDAGGFKVQQTGIIDLLPELSNDLINIFPNLLGVNGSIYIVGTSYRNISGFDRLRFVTGKIVIANNPFLLTIPSFPRLLNVGGQVIFVPPNSSSSIEPQNVDIQQLPPDPPTDICGIGAIIIANNASLTRIVGFDELRQVQDGIFIADNPCLLSICAFPHLYQTDRIVIKGNTKLSAILSFCYIDTINIGLYIFNNNTGGDYDLKISAFINLSHAGRIVISSNIALRSISFDNLSDVDNEFIIRSNPDLQEFSALVLESVGSLIIENNRSLEIINIPCIKTVNDRLQINANCSLLCINGFDKLQRVSHSIIIAENRQLVEISGFQKLKYVGSSCAGRSLVQEPSACAGACGCLANIEYDWNLISQEDCIVIDNFTLDIFDPVVDQCAYVLPDDFFISLCNPATQCGQLPVDVNIPDLVSYSIIIYRNQRLRAIGGFCSLRHLGSNLYIVANPILHTIDAFPNLSWVLDVWIRNNPTLKYILGFKNLIAIRDFVVLESKCLLDLNGIIALEFAQNIAIQARCASSVKYPSKPIPTVFGYTIYYTYPINGQCPPCPKPYCDSN